MKQTLEQKMKTPAGRLRLDFGWVMDDTWQEQDFDLIRGAANHIVEFIHQLTGRDGVEWVHSFLPAVFTRPGWLGKLPFLKEKSFVYPWTQVRLGSRYHIGGIQLIVHELGHVLDNSLGGMIPATFVGGGAADHMIRAVGGNPKPCFPRFVPHKDYVIRCTPQESWSPSGVYANTCVAEDFAETFMWTIFEPDRVPVRRLVWMKEFLSNLKP